jgi:hypothetical protein
LKFFLYGVGFGLTNNLPYLLFAGLFFDQRDRGSKFDCVARKFGDIDYFGPRKLVSSSPMRASLSSCSALAAWYSEFSAKLVSSAIGS